MGILCSYTAANISPVKARAQYAYEGSNAEELPFTEGDELTIVDRSDPDWWKAEQSGVVFIVPAAYLEVVEGQ
jgi:actin cytoskeleton-regulatory complex protein PAN1